MAEEKVTPGKHPSNHAVEKHPDKTIVESWLNQVCKHDTNEVCIHLLNEGDKLICAKLSPPEAERESSGGHCAGVQDLVQHEEAVKKLATELPYNIKNNHFHTDGGH